MKSNAFSVAAVLASFIVGLTSNLAQADNWAQRLENYAAQFVNLQAVELHSQITLHVLIDSEPAVAGDGVPITGNLSFWAKGNRFRVDAAMDPEKYKGMDTAIAFNDEVFQYWIKEDNVLAMTSVATNRLGMTMPVPILEMWQFLYPLDDDNWEQSLLWSQFQNDAQLADRIATGQWQVVDEHKVLGIFPGGTLDGLAYTHQVLFRVYPDLLVPDEIKRVATTGETMTKLTISDFALAGDFYVPTVFEYTAYDDSELIALCVYEATIETNGAIDDSVFQFDASLADMVWDDDGPQQLSYGQPRSIPSEQFVTVVANASESVVRLTPELLR